MFTDDYDSSFCFWVFEKRLTQENCFLFCKKYGLFDGFIFLNNQEIFTIQLSKLSWPAFGEGGGGGREKQNCFSHGEGSFIESIHKQVYSKRVVKFQANVF